MDIKKVVTKWIKEKESKLFIYENGMKVFNFDETDILDLLSLLSYTIDETKIAATVFILLKAKAVEFFKDCDASTKHVQIQLKRIAVFCCLAEYGSRFCTSDQFMELLKSEDINEKYIIKGDSYDF